MLEITWSKFDGGWISVTTGSGETAWEVCEYQDSSSSSEEEEEQEEEEVVVDLSSEETDVNAEPAEDLHTDEDGVLRDADGFEVDPDTQCRVLHSSRNKMDPAFGEGGGSEVFTGFLGDGIVEQIERVSPTWPSRIEMGAEDPMLDCQLAEFVAMMENAFYVSSFGALPAVSDGVLAYAT
jgi:hypothetical protein